ncbi:hypothetical protein BXZ70DRAFT_951828 [Cristinia sonorae]|uniref:F-box domain-containing protein n=1 Tax=Cristinia sonorae TaxID=1940300 RepID=A0A8K0UJN8_9AGAR|nr:hypothetical protein BXZ70DRAFT_951828 [Cristinia sonorae]
MKTDLILQEPDMERLSPWQPKATIHSLPNELMLSIFPLLPLRSLIAARGVSREWNHFSSVSFIPPARKALLELYLEVIKSPSFLSSRKLVADHLRELDREGYIDLLEADTGVPLPDEFRVWVLEWPLNAVCTWLWPGLESIQPPHLREVFPRQTMNLLRSLDIRPRKIHLRHRSTTDNTVVLRPMRHTEPSNTAKDWCWMIIIQVARDPFAMDFLLFGGQGLGAGVQNTVLVVKDDVVRPGMGWVEYLRKELEKQDEAYLKKLSAENAISLPQLPPPSITLLRGRASPRARLQGGLRDTLRGFKVVCLNLLDTASRAWRRPVEPTDATPI